MILQKGGGGGYTVLPLSVCLSFRPSKIFFVAFFSATINGRNLIFDPKLHIHVGMPYCGQRFWTGQIPISCLPTQLVFIHIEHICTFFVAFFSATIDDTNLIFGHKLHIGTPYRGKRFWTRQIPTSCLPKSGGIIREHQLTVHLVFFLIYHRNKRLQRAKNYVFCFLCQERSFPFSTNFDHLFSLCSLQGVRRRDRMVV